MNQNIAQTMRFNKNNAQKLRSEPKICFKKRALTQNVSDNP